LNLRIFVFVISVVLLIGCGSSADPSGSWSDQAYNDNSMNGGTSSQQFSSSDQQSYSEYAQYFRMDAGAPSGGDQLTDAVSYDIRGQEPSTLYVGGQQQKAVSYSQIQPYATFTGGNTLWIQGAGSWTQYVQVPQGASLSLIASTPTGGNAYFYEIYPKGKLDKKSYYFSPYNRLGFYADDPGQHVLLFVINNQASNSVIIDVNQYYPGPIYTGPGYSGMNPGNAKVNIISNTVTGYDVYVDDVYQFTEGDGGVPDGRSSFVITGDTTHKISIRKGGYRYTQSKYFSSGREYTLMIN
jgi:hypothetical protein